MYNEKLKEAKEHLISHYKNKENQIYLFFEGLDSLISDIEYDIKNLDEEASYQTIRYLHYGIIALWKNSGLYLKVENLDEYQESYILNIEDYMEIYFKFSYTKEFIISFGIWDENQEKFINLETGKEYLSYE